MKIGICFILILIALIKIQAQEPKLVLPIGHTKDITISSFSPDGKVLLTASNDHTVKLWEPATGSLLLDFTAHKEDIRQAVFSPDGDMVLSVDQEGIAKLWHTSGLIIWDSLGSSGNVRYAAFSADNRNLILAEYDSVYIFNFSTGKNVSRFFTGYQYEYFLSSGSELMATRYIDEFDIRFWEFPDK
jgi:WD40 repeat protein